MYLCDAHVAITHHLPPFFSIALALTFFVAVFIQSQSSVTFPKKTMMMLKEIRYHKYNLLFFFHSFYDIISSFDKISFGLCAYLNSFLCL